MAIWSNELGNLHEVKELQGQRPARYKAALYGVGQKLNWAVH